MAATEKKRARLILKPCPFCGGERPKLDKFREHDDEPPTYVLECPECCANGPVMGGNKERALAAWNHRGGPPETFLPAARGTPESVEETEEREDSDGTGRESVEHAESCPWCGSRDIGLDSGEVKIGRRKEPYFFAYCRNCEACGPAHDTTGGFAALSWNKRYP